MLTIRNIRLANELFRTPEKMLVDETGENWYEKLKEFSDDTVKISYDSDGQIRMMAMEADRMCPEGLSVSEVAIADVPRNINVLTGMWYYLDGKIIRPSFVMEREARAIRDELLNETDIFGLSDFTVSSKPLSEAQVTEVTTLRNQLKSWPDENGWPSIGLPDVPAWILSVITKRGYSLPMWPMP